MAVATEIAFASAPNLDPQVIEDLRQTTEGSDSSKVFSFLFLFLHYLFDVEIHFVGNHDGL